MVLILHSIKENHAINDLSQQSSGATAPCNRELQAGNGMGENQNFELWCEKNECSCS